MQFASSWWVILIISNIFGPMELLLEKATSKFFDANPHFLESDRIVCCWTYYADGPYLRCIKTFFFWGFRIFYGYWWNCPFPSQVYASNIQQYTYFDEILPLLRRGDCANYDGAIVPASLGAWLSEMAETNLKTIYSCYIKDIIY